MKNKIKLPLIMVISVLAFFSFISNGVAQGITGKIWKPLPLRTQAQKDAGMPGGEGMQMIFSMTYAPSNPAIAFFVTDTEQVWRGEWKQMGEMPGYPDFEGFFWKSRRGYYDYDNNIHKGIRSDGGISLAVDPKNPDVVLVSGSNHDSYSPNFCTNNPERCPSPVEGIYITVDGGESWELIHNTKYYRNKEGRHFAFDPNSFNGIRHTTIYAGTHTEGIFKIEITENGYDLDNLNNYTSDIPDWIYDIEVRPYNDGLILYVASDKGLFRIENDGINISSIPLAYNGYLIESNPYSYPRTIALHPHPTNPALDTIYAAAGEYKVYKSINGGQTFTLIDNGLNLDGRDYRIIDISPACISDPAKCPAGDYLYVSLEKSGWANPFYSSDGGNSWARPDIVLNPLALNEDGLHHNSGTYFSSTTAAHPDIPDVAMRYFGAGRIARTVNGGATWRYDGSGYMGAVRMTNKTAAFFGSVDTQNPDERIIRFCLADHNLIESVDNGDTWRLLPVPPVSTDPAYDSGRAVAVGPDDENIIIYAFKNISKSIDGGENWIVFDGQDGRADTGGSYKFITFHPQDPDFIYAGTWQTNKSWVSNDKGETWVEVGNKEIRAVYPGDGDIVYAFEACNSSEEDKPQPGCLPGRSITWRSSGIERDASGKRTTNIIWEEQPRAINPFKKDAFYDVDIAPDNLDRLYIAKQSWASEGWGGLWVLDGNVLQSTGESISKVCSGIGSAYQCSEISDGSTGGIEREYFSAGYSSHAVNSVAVDPNNPDIVYAGMWFYGGGMRKKFIYRSTDYGMTWEDAGLNLDGYSRVYGLAVDPANSVLYMSSSQGQYVLCTDDDYDEYAKEGGPCGPVDCDDNDTAVNPGHVEICDGKDNNCDGDTDEGFDDTDSDGIKDCVDPDDDSDGLTDDDEINVHGTDPLNPDTDSDGSNDGEEIQSGTMPLHPDTDRDGILDGQDIEPLNIFSPNSQGWKISRNSDFSTSDTAFATTDTFHVIVWSNIANAEPMKKKEYKIKNTSGDVHKEDLAGTDFSSVYKENVALSGFSAGPYIVEIWLRDNNNTEYEVKDIFINVQ